MNENIRVVISKGQKGNVMKKLACLVAIGSLSTVAVPAQAAEFGDFAAPKFATTLGTNASFGFPGMSTSAAFADDDWDDWDDDDRRYRRDRRYREYDRYGRYREPRRISRRDRIWRGRDGRYYCERDNGTTGLIIGAGVGALLGRTIDTRGDRTVGTLLGGALGAVLGREIDRGELRCR